MKKIISLILSAVLSVSLALPAYAAVKDTLPPKVKSTNPINSRSNININQNIKIYYNESITKGKTYAKISLKKSNGISVNYKSTISKNVLSIIPVKHLENCTKYYLSIPSGAISDKSKNTTKKAYMLIFQTKSSLVVQNTTPIPETKPTSASQPTPSPTPEPTAPPNYAPKYTAEQLKSWGLGSVEQEYVSNDRNYDWYIDQGHTGTYADSNCGPSSVTMAVKWFDPNFSKTAEDARNTYRSSGGWWYTEDVTNYLAKYNVPYKVIDNYGQDIIKNLTNSLAQGNIFILCVDTSYIKLNTSLEQRTGKYYSYNGGHFLIVKGYIKVDNTVYFEVYDPNNWDHKYSDGTQKGKDRFYKSNELIDAMQYWWNYYIQIQPKATGSGSSPNQLAKRNIPNQHGGHIKNN